MTQIKVEYVNHMGNDLTVVNAARISHANESDTLTEGDIKLINYLAKHEHMSPFEHCQLSVIVHCPLYIRSQIHRHRTFAYNEISRRYTSEDIEFFYPERLRYQDKVNRQGSQEEVPEGLNTVALKEIREATEKCVELYEKMLGNGIGKELARMILPQHLMTRFYMSGNLRNWSHFVRLRIDPHAQKEVQEIGHGVLKYIEQYFPESYKALSNNRLGVVS